MSKEGHFSRSLRKGYFTTQKQNPIQEIRLNKIPFKVIEERNYGFSKII